MTDPVATPPAPAEAPERRPTDWKGNVMQRRIARRYAAERRFHAMGLGAVLLSVGFLAFLLVTMIGNGASGFRRTEVLVPVDFAHASIRLDPASFRGPGRDAALAAADFEGVLFESAQQKFGGGSFKLLSEGAWLAVRNKVADNPDILKGQAAIWVPASSAIDRAAKSGAADADLDRVRKVTEVRTSFDLSFLTGADSTDPTMVGVWGAFKGSLLTMLVTLALAFPVGVLSALYLEEYAPRNRWTDLIEVSINNLAAVPSIIFGLLGLAVFLNTMNLPRSAPIVGGLTLALMTMPVIVIAGRNAIKAVPPSIRDAALGIGASRVQVVFHHVLPLALPGILTGTIIGMARALGETAPLLMIGMRAFVSAPPGGLTDPATVLPVQIFLWSDEVSKGFVEKTSAAIIVLLVFLMAMNGLAIYLRNRFERRW
ncbi:phosphate ABC transporter permease PstA [Sphingomonas crocodyli]|nr:phosphate ABC transporter permease PstA [Sphingomonas crocodyli]